MKRTLPVLLIFALFSADGASQPGALEEPSPDFAGAWNLVSWELRLEDGSTRPHRWNLGSLIYSDSGRMCWVGMEANRPTWREGSDPTNAEIIEAFQGVASYCARVEVNADQGFVLHHVDLGQYPNDHGIVRKRWFSFDGADRLVLTIDPAELSPPVVESTLVWERVGM